MILLVHLLFGAAIGSAIKNIYLAVILAFLSHYLLDILPHIEYPIENIEEKQWRKAMPDILRVALDFCLGILLILILSKNQPIIYICAFLAILPDGFTVLHYLAPNKILKIHNKLHEKIHFLKYSPSQIPQSGNFSREKLFDRVKKISTFWRIFSQVAVVIISIILLIKY